MHRFLPLFKDVFLHTKKKLGLQIIKTEFLNQQ